jgi:16S rRNA (cytosine1402-N4)-methyltransferase
MAEHIPVLLNEVTETLAVQPGGRYIDCTLGAGGHAAAILEKSSPGGQLLGIDADPAAVALAKENLAAYGDAALLVNDNFANLKEIVNSYNFAPVHGILLDLGLSSMQLAWEGRGFSFQEDAPLDMRFGPGQRTTAADIVNNATENELAKIIFEYGEERLSRRIAKQILANRPIRTTAKLASVVEAAVGGRRGRIHPATRTFQALRIAVNHELENLQSVLEQAVEVLGYEGRLVVISYHSLEDRIVKQFFSQEAKDCICPPETLKCACRHHAKIKLINRKVVVPSAAEIRANPRSRSARLRAAERLIDPAEKYLSIGKHVFLIQVKNSGWRKQSVHRNLQKEVLKM